MRRTDWLYKILAPMWWSIYISPIKGLFAQIRKIYSIYILLPKLYRFCLTFLQYLSSNVPAILDDPVSWLNFFQNSREECRMGVNSQYSYPLTPVQTIVKLRTRAPLVPHLKTHYMEKRICFTHLYTCVYPPTMKKKTGCGCFGLAGNLGCSSSENEWFSTFCHPVLSDAQSQCRRAQPQYHELQSSIKIRGVQQPFSRAKHLCVNMH